jgi:hypothetical protein
VKILSELGKLRMTGTSHGYHTFYVEQFMRF